MPARAILVLENQAALPKRMTETTYAAEMDPICAEKEVDFVVADDLEPAKGDEGYLLVDVEYEQPIKRSILPTPAPPRSVIKSRTRDLRQLPLPRWK